MQHVDVRLPQQPREAAAEAPTERATMHGNARGISDGIEVAGTRTERDDGALEAVTIEPLQHLERAHFRPAASQRAEDVQHPHGRLRPQAHVLHASVRVPAGARSSDSDRGSRFDDPGEGS